MEINDHGIFWWTSEGYEAGSATGILSVDPAGVIKLELHQTLPGRSGMGGVFGEILPEPITILGCLKSNGHYVLLKGLRAQGGRSGLISFEIFWANECFISQKPLEFINFFKLSISLDGLQQWVRPGRIEFYDSLDKVKDEARKIKVNLDLNSSHAWQISWGLVEITHDFSGSVPGLHSEAVNIAMTSYLSYTPTIDTTCDEFLDWYRSVQDLLLILTNSNITLSWPRLLWRKGDEVIGVNYYFRRHAPTGALVKWHETLLPFARIQDTFGNMIETWLSKRKSLGPGISLYLGTRRNRPLYAEHRFVNLVWGLEALDRRVDSSRCDDLKLKEKIQGLTEFVEAREDLNRSDRKWLVSLLKSRGFERPLSERLYEMLKPVAIGIDDGALKAFTKACADMRNDLSHHGGEREPGGYSNFINDLVSRSEALSKLYLLLILSLLGISSEEIEFIIYRNPASFEFSEAFRQAGLLPERYY
ncbi:HEPN domain-containing protein [Stutzerimonas kirkiae]|uniref:ApeA N-terminal domain 1-containing protein n=1 Tax=Stutzerimonas kirkiae TaxID=2211392 RepID=UPI001037D18D|nr:HEPN domain-containing protein [Stutzerimonas kirkiae]